MPKKKKEPLNNPDTNSIRTSSAVTNKAAAKVINILPKSGSKLFPIAAIGASAGGLEAFIALIKNLASNTGMAFVYVMHLSPVHKSNLIEILSRNTSLKVQSAENGGLPEPNNIYVIKPDTQLTIENGSFKLVKRPHKTGKVFMPIDTFMLSLANDNRHYALGVLLSGTDSDGVIGMEHIKSNGGLTFVQDPRTAKFSEIPKNAISAGVVDYIFNPEKIGVELSSLSRNLDMSFKRIGVSDEILPGVSDEVNKIYHILKYTYGVDFTDYKPATIKRRILRRMVMNKTESIKDFIKVLRNNPNELKKLYDDLLIHVTSFFRDSGMYESLRKLVFPRLFEKKKPDEPLRIWVSACSTGEEAYSLAITLLEYLGSNASKYRMQIFATDLSDIGIDMARSGVYSHDVENDVPAVLLKKYFKKFENGYQVIKKIRDMCIFAKQNLVQDPPFSKIDLVSCRNLLIYLGHTLQNKIFPVFHYSLKPDGYLVLGTSESVGSFSNLFSPVDKKNKIFRKRNVSDKMIYNFSANDYTPPANNIPLKQPIKIGNKIHNAIDLQRESDAIIASKFAPAHVVINKDLEVLQFRGNTSLFLDFPQGIASFNILKMIKESLAIDLRSMLKKAFSGINIIKKENIPLRHGNILRQVNLTVLPMAGSYPDEKLYIVVFEEAKNVKPAKDTSQGKTKKTNTEEANRFAMLKKELENTKDHLQAIIEQQESTNEELRAANEEIQSSNEELQSTNEELETAKEELQSTNEELTTVNEELQNRNAELQSLNNDLNNLLVSINIPVIILDHNLKIRRFTKVTERIFNIIPLDIGRKITDLNLGFEIPDFEKQLHAVIDLPCIKEINIKDKNENWYSMRIRPYKTTDNKIDGVVLALVEISGLRKSIDSLTESKMEAESLNKVLRLKDRARIKEFEKASTTFETQMLAAKNAEEALRILSHHLVEGQESERLKISRDLHDSVNQMLTAVKIKIHGIIKKSGGMNGSKSLAGDLENINKMLNDSINEIRRITKNLRPGMIDDLGLDIALKSLIDEFRERNKIRLTYTGNKIDGKLSKDSELTVYRVIQEALQNIEKHSEAKQVNIQLKLDKSMLSLVIKDNGKGFKPEGNFKSNIAKKKFGLISMKERVESVGGRLEIKSKIPNGTKIMIEIPVKNKKIK